MRDHAPPVDRGVRWSFDSDEETAIGSDAGLPLLEKEVFDNEAQSASKAIWEASPTGVPSFLKASTSFPTSKSNTNSIAALDGLRGLACLFVFNEHLTYNFSTTFLYGYGVEERRHFIQWPFIRIFWSGFSMVSIFYVISGYVVSYKPLRQIRANDMEGFHATLASSVFRRAMRLYLPTIIAVLICGLLVSFGAFNYSSAVFFKDRNPYGLHECPPPIHDTLYLQMTDALKHALQMLNFWDWSDELSADDYDRHLWTIVVVEFRSSMVLLLFLIGVSRLKGARRVLAGFLLILFCIVTERKDVLLFVSGMLLAELDLIRKSHAPTSAHTHNHDHTPPSSQHRRLRLPTLTTTISTLTFLFSLYLLSTPTLGAAYTPFYSRLLTLTPSWWLDRAAFPRSLGAILLVYSVTNTPLVQPLFTNSLTLYLGKISYALYLVHGNVLKSLVYSLIPGIYRITNSGVNTKDGVGMSMNEKEDVTTTTLILSWFLCALVTVPVTFYISDLFWRFVDLPCVRFAKWVEGRVSIEFEEEGKDRGPS